MTTIFIANLGVDKPKYAQFGLSDPFLAIEMQHPSESYIEAVELSVGYDGL